MEAVIHQTLRQIIHLEAGAAPQIAQIKNAFVGHKPAFSPEQHRVMGIQPMRQIIGRQQGHSRGLPQASRAHQTQIHPADRQDACAAQGGSRYR